ncbi:heavy metal translocating P-type ATPase [Salinithrix halophila]|uniref:Heavy metal translocating P-type ATPase n=1 Tax=Salinithrix halophila TaxID=1485204 RepID=A0ABV8JC61_9BACL
MKEGIKRDGLSPMTACRPVECIEKGAGWRRNLKRHGEGAAALLCGLLILVAWLTEGNAGYVSPFLYLVAYVVGGFVKAGEGIMALYKAGKLDVNLLMLFAGGGAAVIGFWMEGALLIFIFSLSGALESYSEQRSRRDLSSLLSLQPQSAWLWTKAGERRISIDALKIGDVVAVKPGEQIPADGTVLEGRSEVDQAAITGESVPVDKEAGNQVFAGTLNGQGSLFVRVDHPASESTFSKIVQLVEEAKTQQPPVQRRIDRLEGLYAWSIVAVTLWLILVPPFLWEWTLQESVYRGMVFLVVASPCAVVASIMPAVLSAMSWGARRGMLFKGGAYVQSLGEVNVVAFDKTGTLTRGELQVTDVLTFGAEDDKELLAAAASVESLSEHPIARAIVTQANQRGISCTQPESFRSKTGYGVEAEWNGTTWRLGKPGWLAGDEEAEELCRLEGEGKTVICIRSDHGAVGLIALRDTIRPEARTVVRRLKELGVQVVMLTGDRRQAAAAIADEVGIDWVEAELLPEEKVNALHRWQRRFGLTAMVGDGVNDAPALAVADIGVAMGAAGSDVALETARVVLMHDDLNRVADAIALGKRTGFIIRQNLLFASVVITCLITANFLGVISLPFGVIGHEGSTLLVILNGLRLLK